LFGKKGSISVLKESVGEEKLMELASTSAPTTSTTIPSPTNSRSVASRRPSRT